MRSLVLLVAVAAALAAPATADATRLSGRVLTGRTPLARAQVKLYAAGPVTTALGGATTDADGRFAVDYAASTKGRPRYAIASGGDAKAGSAVRLMAVAGAGNVLTVNELSTVASAYALARFLRGTTVRGSAPGLPNAALTAPELVTPATGTVGATLANPPNGAATDTLASVRTLAGVLGGCTQGTRADCRALFRVATSPGAATPANTLQAAQSIALHPTNHARALFHLPRSRAFGPGLSRAPGAWVLSLQHTDGGYDGPGRMAFDSRDNIWVTNNFEPPGTEAGLGVIALDPLGRARNNSPVTGGGIQGNWWGIAVDQSDRVWLSNFTGADPNPFNSPDFKGGNATSLFTSDAQALSPAAGFQDGPLQAPQGIAVDQAGNVWIANHGNASVTEYVGGDHTQSRVFTGGGLHNPFAIEADGHGNVWVDDGSLDAAAPGTLTEIDSAGDVTGPYDGDGMHSPQGMAFDSAGNLWVASLVDDDVTRFNGAGQVQTHYRAASIQGAWSVAVDGDDNLWVTSFIGSKLTELCGRNPAKCPTGTRTGDPLSPPLSGFTNGGLQHLTAVQIDQSGNVWVANNWAQIDPTVGGDGLVEFIGAAAPVRTPLIGLPQPAR